MQNCTSFKDQKVAIVGMGISNQSLCRYLLKEGAVITCFDKKNAKELGAVYDEFSELGVEWSLGEGYLESLPSYGNIFLTPGMRKNQPKVLEAKKRGAFISTEIALFLQRCKAKVGGVTGSAGKTTSSTLAFSMLKHSLPKREILLGGNVGSVLIEKVDDIPEDAIVVLELSSFQLQMCDVSPDVSLLLNIRPNHLDIHSDFEEYVNSKKNIFRFQNREDWVFLNHDEQLVRNMSGECPGNVGFFSLVPPHAHNGCSGIPWAFLDGENLIYVTETGQATYVAKKSDILIPGQHNISNVLGATLLSMRLGATDQGVRDAISAFHGLEHRIEYVCEKDGVKFYNDSIATSPDRTIALIQSMPGPLVLILGGYDKGLSFDELGEKIVDAHAKVVLLGACAGKIEESIKKAAATEKRAWHEVLKVVHAKDLEEAVRLASSLASPGDSVVLSPACASYDMFSDFEERGRLFKDLVRNLCS